MRSTSYTGLAATGLTATVLIAAVLAGSGVATAQTVDAGRGDVPVTLPSGYTGDTAAPLIVLLHGFGSTGAGQNEYMKVSALADSYGFILVAPDGTATEGERFGMKNPRFWNASEACCNFDGVDVDDSAYISGLIHAVKARYRIDGKRVFLVGHSNGGFMSYRLAHEHSGTIAAIASLAGADQSGTTPAPSHAVHVLQIHGTADETIAYDGGELPNNAGYPGAKQSVENWAARNGCAVTGVDAGTLDLEGQLDGAESTITRYADGCRAGGSAELWSIAGGGHIPGLSDHFTKLVVEWLLGHPKP